MYCASPCSAYVLSPVQLLYDLVERVWCQLAATGDAPPSKHMPAYVRADSTVYMFGGLLPNHRTISTPCTYSFHFPNRTWTYHHTEPPPFQDTGL